MLYIFQKIGLRMKFWLIPVMESQFQYLRSGKMWDPYFFFFQGVHTCNLNFSKNDIITVIVLR